MLAAAVDAVKRLLVENHLEMMLLGNFRHENHKEHVLVDRPGEFTEHRSALKLIGSHLIMPCLKLDAELVSLGLEVLHERLHLGRNCPEIVVGELLVFG